jgi:hypothetical protein
MIIVRLQSKTFSLSNYQKKVTCWYIPQRSASTCFSTFPANDNVKHLITKTLPSRSFVEAMRKEFGQALLDGAV